MLEKLKEKFQLCLFKHTVLAHWPLGTALDFHISEAVPVQNPSSLRWGQKADCYASTSTAWARGEPAWAAGR